MRFDRELSVERDAPVALEEPSGSEVVENYLNESVITPARTTAAVSRIDAHADKGRLSDVETELARLRG
jgi:hypothetical protein